MITRRRTAPLVALAASLLLVAVGCGDDRSASSGDPTTPSTALPAISTTEAPAIEDVEPAAWEQIAAPPECACSDGSEYHYWIRRADRERVVFFLEGGGACFSAETCGPASPSFKRNLSDGAGASVPAGGGIFDLSDPRNPFASWSMVFVPYCTGDLHLGDATHDYGNDVVVQHLGAVNGRAALDATVEAFPDAREVVVAGSSAGSAGAPLYAGLAHDLLPEAAVTLLADGSGAYPDDGALTSVVGSLWGVFEGLPDWPEQTGPPPDHWTLPRLLLQAERHVPEMRIANLNNAYDDVQALFSTLIGRPGDLLPMIEANNQLIEDEGVDLHSWIGPGTEHTVLGRDAFYEDEVDGTVLRDWVVGVVEGRDVADVRCTVCR